MHFENCSCVNFTYGLGSSVGIATDYGMNGTGSNPGGDEIFRSSRPSLEPTQPPLKWLTGLSRGKVRPGRAADHSPPSSAAVMEEYRYTSTHPLGHTGPVTGSLYLCLLLILHAEMQVAIRILPNYCSSHVITAPKPVTSAFKECSGALRIFVIIFLHGLGHLTCSGIDALPSFPGTSAVSSSSRFVLKVLFRKSGVVHSFEVVDPVVFVFESHVL